MFKYLISKFQLGRDVLRRRIGILLFDKQKNTSELPMPLSNIVLLRWDAKWGDAIVSSFIFSALRATYPEIKIQVVTTPQMAELFEKYFKADKVLKIKKRPNYNELKLLAKEIGEIDALVHMSPKLKLKDIYFLDRVDTKLIIGLDDEIKLINRKLGKATKDLHFSEKFKLVLTALGADTDNLRYQVPIQNASQDMVKSFLDDHKITDFIAFNPFGNGNARKMNEETINTVIQKIKEVDNNIIIILLHSPETKALTEAVSNENENVYFFSESRSIYDAISIVFYSKSVISVDTSIVHIASGLNKPLFAIYNPDDENYAAWHPNNAQAISIFSKKVDIPNINLLPTEQLDVDLKSFVRKYHMEKGNK